MSYAAALPDVAQPHCLKVRDALAALGRFEEANLAYTRALENLDQPVYLGGQVIVNQELIGNMMSRALYYNRGNVHAAADDHRAAVADFDAALLHGYSPKRDVLHNRGSSKFALEMYAEAHQDLEAAWLGVPPKLIIFNGFLVGAGAQHCQGQIRQRDRFATTMTIPTRNGDFGVTRAGSEWPARRAHSTACPNA